MSENNVSTSNYNSKNRKMEVPTDIYVPEYLNNYLKDMEIPEKIDNAFLIKLGMGALTAKIADIEEYNMAVKTGKKRVPSKLDFDDASIIMMSLYTFRNIQMTERADDIVTTMYDDKAGTYVTSYKQMYEIMRRLATGFKEKDKQDVMHDIESAIPTVEPTKDKNLFAVNNGIYNKLTGELMPFDRDYVFLTKIPIDYHNKSTNPVITAPDGFNWNVEDWIKDIMDDDLDATTLIWQVIADCLQPNYSRHKSIWFYSEKGNNGKGTVGQLIKNLLGKGNYASLSVDDFNHEYLKETLLGTAANIADENDVDVWIDSVKDYKASITGDDININRKYEKPLRVQYLGTNLQMMNGLPKTKDKSDSVYRRLIIVPFLKSFTNNGERKYIKDDYIGRQDVLEYVLHVALNMDFDDYITPLVSSELLHSYKEKNNPVMEFWNELKDEFIWDLLPTPFLYDVYKSWHMTNNPSGKPMSSRSFIDTLRAVVQSQGDAWEDKSSRTDKVRSMGKMYDDEPLITTFGLDKIDKTGRTSRWANDTYNGTNTQKKREFTRSVSYRGFVRL